MLIEGEADPKKKLTMIEDLKIACRKDGRMLTCLLYTSPSPRD